MRKQTITGILALLLAVGAVLGAAATPAAALDRTQLIADIDPWQVTLQDGRWLDRPEVGHVAPTIAAQFTKRAIAMEQLQHENLLGVAEHQIVMLGQPTGYWTRISLFTMGQHHATCEVFEGAPSAGGHLAEPSPFTCSTRGASALEGQKITFTIKVGLNRDAESSGSIAAGDGVFLEDGHYQTYDLPYSAHGATSVAAGSSTEFDTVVRVGDPTGVENPAVVNQARTEFSYRIHDGDGATAYWVAGLSTNHRGKVMFSGDGRCAIYDHDPLADGGYLDDSAPIEGAAPYVCSADGDFKSGPHESGRGNFFTAFSVKAAPAA